MKLIIKKLTKYILIGTHNYEQLFIIFDSHDEAHSFMSDIYFEEIDERYGDDAETVEYDLEAGLLSFERNYIYISSDTGYQVDLEINEVDFTLLDKDGLLKKYAVAGIYDNEPYLRVFDNYNSAYNDMVSTFKKALDENYWDDEERLRDDMEFGDVIQDSNFAFITQQGYGEFELSIHEISYNTNS